MKNVVAFALMLVFVFALISTDFMMVAGKLAGKFLLTLYKTSRELVERGHPDIT